MGDLHQGRGGGEEKRERGRETFIGIEQSWDGWMDPVSRTQIGTVVICPGSPLPYLEGGRG